MTTNTKAPFSLFRIVRLMGNRLLDDLPAIAVCTAGIAAGNILSILLGNEPLFNNGANKGQLWTLTILLGGILLTGNAFSRMHDGRSGPDWILLPASSMEKYLSTLATYLLIFPLGASIVSFSLSALLYGIGNLSGVGGGIIWNPLEQISLQNAEVYIFFCIIALAGSARFRKFALGKTATVLFVFGAVISSLFIFLLLRFIGEAQLMEQAKDGTLLNFPMRVYEWISILFALGYGFALVREKESKDEVQ